MDAEQREAAAGILDGDIVEQDLSGRKAPALPRRARAQPSLGPELAERGVAEERLEESRVERRGRELAGFHARALQPRPRSVPGCARPHLAEVVGGEDRLLHLQRAGSERPVGDEPVTCLRVHRIPIDLPRAPGCVDVPPPSVAVRAGLQRDLPADPLAGVCPRRVRERELAQRRLPFDPYGPVFGDVGAERAVGGPRADLHGQFSHEVLQARQPRSGER